MTLDDKDLRSFQDHGYLVVPAVVPLTKINALRQLVFRIYAKLVPDHQPTPNQTPWNDPWFDQRLCELRSENARLFGSLYDCAQSSVALTRLVTDPNVANAVAHLLGDPPEDLAYSGIMLRMDAPRDRRNVLSWHQDRAYYPQNLNGDNGVVVTIAMQDTPIRLGALNVCPGSHREGLVKPEQTNKDDYESTEQRAVPQRLVDKYQPAMAELKKGDMLVIHMNVFHRSGDNMSDSFRFSALARYHRIMAPDFVPFGLLYQFNDFMAERAEQASAE
ncbi:MAG: phytanoyl-CoA dioxygenase family protein [Alphaproteobacteria bacterium]